MPRIIIDAGNTHVKLVMWPEDVFIPDFQGNRFVSGKIADQPEILGSVPTALVANPAEFSSRITALFGKGFKSAILVSVVPEVDRILETILQDLETVGRDGEYPYPHEILNAQTVGPDRFCNMAAAVAAGLDSALVVDAGTATTFDLLLDGVFKGGLIAPGMAFASRQLARQGAMLEDAPFEIRPAVVGRDTQEAMMGGAWLTGCGGVEWTIAHLLETYGNVPVILTGGLGKLLPLKNRCLDPFWTLRGAAHLGR